MPAFAGRILHGTNPNHASEPQNVKSKLFGQRAKMFVAALKLSS
jgi:hypothetical protein